LAIQICCRTLTLTLRVLQKYSFLICALTIIVVGAQTGFSQRSWTWCIGWRTRISFPFGGNPVVFPGQANLTHYENGATISDRTGGLLFYLNEDSIIGKTHQILPNGRLTTNHFGYTVGQGSLILPNVADSNRYEVFQLGWPPGSNAGSSPLDSLFLRKTTVNMALNAGIGDVELPKEVPINRGHPLVEKLSAVKHANGKDWWLVVHERDSNAFLVYLLNESGLQGPSRQNIGSNHDGSGWYSLRNFGEMCFSPLGDRLLVCVGSGIVDLFDFDRCSGTISNWVQVENTPGFMYYGCSFSPDGNKYYVSDQFSLWQYDLTNTSTLLATIIAADYLGQHELGPNGKIYIAAQGGTLSTRLTVIDNPNGSGASCNLILGSLACGGTTQLHLPNFPNYNLGPLLAQTAEAGPPQAVLCLGDSIHIGYPDTTGGAVTYAWQSHPDIADTSQPQPWVTPTQSSWYYLTVVDSAFGIPCGVTRDSIHVIVADSSYFPVANAGNDTSFCAGDSVLIGMTENPAWTYLWSPTGQDTSQISVSQPGNYTLIVTNPAGLGACLSDTNRVVVDTYPLLPLPANSAGMNQVLCLGDSLWICAGNAGFGYQWNGGLFPDSSRTLITDTGVYVLSIFNPDSLGGCLLGTDTVVVAAFDSLLLLPGFAGNDTVICQGDSVLLGIPLPPQWIGSWTPTAGLLTPNELVTAALPTTTTTFVLIATDTTNQGTCASVSDTVNIKVELPFEHPIPQNQEFCPGEILQIGVPSVSAFTYAWSPVTGLQNPYVSATTVAPLTPIVYTLAITSDTMISENCRTQYFPVALTTDGCVNQNVVTPNGDGINDFLDLGSFNGAVSVSIYDRWGALVFASDGYGNDWPENGSALPESVYYYVVKVAHEGGKAFVGEVMVVR
jgi:gliding motility-associated-like protein